MRKIFLLEDDQGIREVLEILLLSENYSVLSFSSIAEFMERDILVVPDLYLFDVMLPDGSGIDLRRELKKDHDDGVPVLIMSAHAELRNLEGICDADDFIRKPFDIEHLLNRVRLALV